MISGRGEERAELVGGPDLEGFGLAISRPLRPGGRVGGEQLFDVHGISQCLAERAVDVGNGGRGQGPAVPAAVFGQVAVELGDHRRAQGL